MRGKGIKILDSFELAIDVQLDASGKIDKGMVLGDTLYQNQALILLAHNGEVKSNPLVGVGISDMQLDSDLLGWRQRIRQQMELDGQTVNKIIFKTDKSLQIDAKY
jgi:hypothetical protein